MVVEEDPAGVATDRLAAGGEAAGIGGLLEPERGAWLLLDVFPDRFFPCLRLPTFCCRKMLEQVLENVFESGGESPLHLFCPEPIQRNKL